MFRMPLRIYIEDTDAGGIVFYANYLKFFERARTEFVRSLGVQLRDSLTNNINYVVHSIDLQYIKSAKLDDVIDVSASVSNLGRSFIEFRQSARDQSGNDLVKGHVKVACVNFSTGKPRRLEPHLYDALVATMQG